MSPQNKMEKIRDFLKNPFVIIGIIIQIIFIILIIILIQNITKKDTVVPDVKIQNTFEDISNDLPKEAAKYFERSLYEIVSLNSKNITNISDSGAHVRENSISQQYLNEINVRYIHFIVDIPSIQQSYQISYQWSDDTNNKKLPTNNSLMSMCLPREKMIYPDFNCQDRYNHNGPKELIKTLTNQITLKVNNQSFSVIPKGRTSDDNFYFQVAINTCGNDDLKNKATQVFEKQVKDLGFELSEIPYQTIGYCDR